MAPAAPAQTAAVVAYSSFRMMGRVKNSTVTGYIGDPRGFETSHTSDSSSIPTLKCNDLDLAQQTHFAIPGTGMLLSTVVTHMLSSAAPV